MLTVKRVSWPNFVSSQIKAFVGVPASLSLTDISTSPDFGSAIAGACAQWEVQGTAASDLAAATKALASELAGKSPGAAATGTESAGSGDATQTGASAGPSSSSEGPAAAATPIIGLLGGAAALAGLMI